MANKIVIHNSHDLITHTRFDVIIKYMYAKAIKNGYGTTYFHDVYKEHLRVWNGFKEYNNPNKVTFESFDSIFKKLIYDIGSKGFDPEISKIPIYKNKYLLNGAHRLASAMVHNTKVHCFEGVNGKDGQLDCGYDMFNRLGLDINYSDRTAIEYAKLKNNTHMVFIFPSAKGRMNEVVNILNRYGHIIYGRKVSINETGSFNLMRELYLGEDLAGNFQNNFFGFRHKQSLCYPSYEPTSGYLVEFDSLESSVNAKDEIRSLYNIGKHSTHINDTHEETIRLSKLIFNKNSVHHLNNTKTADYKVFDKCLVEFKHIIESMGLDIDDYCIGGSSPLSAYGLREGNDLDYLHSNPTEIKDSADLIHSHNDYGVGRYHLGRDEIIYNPENYFYHRGIKFASLGVVKALKEKRGEPKDKVDVNLINSVL